MSLNSSHRLYGIGTVLLLSLLLCSRNFSRTGAPSFLLFLGIAGIAYLLAVREFLSETAIPKHVLIFGLLIAAVWHVVFLRVPPGADDDIHRYVWDGRVQRLGYNPYILVPADPTWSTLHTSETRTLNHPDLPSPYPPGAELFFRAVSGIHESVMALKIAFALCDVAIVLLLLDLLRHAGQAEHWVLVFAWHPLLATEVAGSGHVDIVGVLFLVLSVAALLRRWRTLAALAFGFAVSVKLLPIVLLPIYWKRVRLRDGALAALAAGLLYLPFLENGRIPVGSLGTYVRSFRFNNPVFETLDRVVAPEVAAGVAVLVGLLAAVWMRTRFAESTPEAFAWPMATSLLCAPVVYPWYLLWLLPFLRSVSTMPLAIWTVSIIPTYVVWYLRTLGRPWVLPGWVLLLEYGSVAVAATVFILRRITRSGTPRRSPQQAE